ncbi:BQ2448_5928 [Microbotryum intermedium]|uniref:BQ2448_5928 protein n=1 Tax=Microbotryum intermedium TaxID=269621 RepID=A0A238EZJ5_9BASI|nr:BQ2448_5928 [Microbotryum intermedium]
MLPQSDRLSPIFDPPSAPSSSRLAHPPSDLGPGPLHAPTSSPKRNKTSPTSRTQTNDASTSAPSGSKSQKSSIQIGGANRSRDQSGRYQCEGDPSARTIRRRLLPSSSSSVHRASGGTSRDSHSTKGRSSKAVEQAPTPRERDSSPVHKTGRSSASSSTHSATPAFSSWARELSKARMASQAAVLKAPSTSTKTSGAPSSTSNYIPDHSHPSPNPRTSSRTPSPTEVTGASWRLLPKLEPSPQMGPKPLKPTSSMLRARYPTPPVSISSARGSSVDLRTYHDSHGGTGSAAAPIDVIFIDDTDDDDAQDGQPSSPKRARSSRDHSDEYASSTRQKKGTVPTSPRGGSSRRNPSRTADLRSAIRSSTIPTPEQYSIDPELFIASANWSRRIIIDVVSLKIDCIAFRDGPGGQAVDHELGLELALVANVDGVRTELDLINECVRLECCASNATRLILAGSRTHSFELDFDSTAFRTATDVQLDLTLRNLDGEEWNAYASLPISDCDVRGEEHIIPYGLEQPLRFSKTATAQIAYRSSAMMDNRISEVAQSARELNRRLDRVRLENDPVWLPDALDVASIQCQEARGSRQLSTSGQTEVLKPVDHGPTRSTYDFVTKRPLIVGQRIMEPSTTETPFSTIQVRHLLNALLRRTSYTTKERLVRRLHHSWTLLNPFPPSILSRELACWNHFAPVVEHFMACQELEWFLWTSLVMNGEQNEYRGLLSVSEWEEVRKMYRKQVRRIEKGKRQSYEVWRRGVEESAR